MTTAALLARAEAAGLTVDADGDRLRLRAAAPPPPALLHDLAGRKADLLALLERRADEAAERAAIQGEPELPPIGSPEWQRAEAMQRTMAAGLLIAARRPCTQ